MTPKGGAERCFDEVCKLSAYQAMEVFIVQVSRRHEADLLLGGYGMFGGGRYTPKVIYDTVVLSIGMLC